MQQFTDHGVSLIKYKAPDISMKAQYFKIKIISNYVNTG